MNTAFFVLCAMSLRGNLQSDQTPQDAPGLYDTAKDKPKIGEKVAVIETTKGDITVMFYRDKAPLHVQNFTKLATSGFYNKTRFHRCIPGFMIQGGDPMSKKLSKSSDWGTGGHTDAKGNEIQVPAEFNDIRHSRGVLSMSRSNDPDSASSQFFIMVAQNLGLDGQYSAFGKVVSGMAVVDKIVATGSNYTDMNGMVPAKRAVLIRRIRVTTWPVKKK